MRTFHETTKELLETEHERQVKSLLETTRGLTHASDRYEAAGLLAETASTVLRYPLNVVWVIEGSSELSPAAVTGNLEPELEAPQSTLTDSEDPIAKAYVSGEPAFYDDLHEAPGNVDGGANRSAMYLPLGEHGVLSLIDTAAGSFKASDQELAALLAAIGKSALDRLNAEQNRSIDKVP